mmetsp:Transcript_26134/g.42058  ORF Transcript_26134/g.42058 Transcript_26134/m.42058 type:complete len:151 (-) Transcript_26134:177-629(-)
MEWEPTTSENFSNTTRGGVIPMRCRWTKRRRTFEYDKIHTIPVSEHKPSKKVKRVVGTGEERNATHEKESSISSIELRVRDAFHGSLYKAFVNPDDTVLLFKRRLQKDNLVHINFLLIHRGKILQDNCRIGSKILKKKDIVVIIPRGGKQ